MALTPEQIQQLRQQYKIGHKEQPQGSTVGSLLGIAKDLTVGAAKGLGAGIQPLLDPRGGLVGRTAMMQDQALNAQAEKAYEFNKQATGLTDQNITPANTTQTVGSFIPAALPLAGMGAKAAVKAAAPVAKEVMGATKSALPSGQGAAESIMNRIGRINPTKRNEFKSMTGQDVGEYLVSRGHVGNTEETIASLAKDFQSSIKAVDDTLANAPDVRFTNPAVGAALKELEQKAAATSTVGAKSPFAGRVAELKKLNQGAGLNLKETNEVKRMYERNVKLDYMKENLTDKVQLANNIDSAIRNHLFAKAKELGIE